MTTILFILCFTLLAIAFFMIILLYLKITQLKDIEKKQERLLKEFESVITSYVLEMKEENEVFLHRIKDVKLAKTASNYEEKNDAEVVEEEKNKPENIQIKELELTKEDIQALLPSYPDKENTKDLSGIITDNETEEKLPSKEEDDVGTLIKDIELLQKMGLSQEEIAKKLNKGKTEIELLLKFRQNN
ncbi:hypothetical protein [Ferdinandcohnia sp. Marseille-Q9671]